MAPGNNKPQRDDENHSSPDPALVSQILSNQKLEIELQREEISLRRQELDNNAKLAQQSLRFQAEYLKEKPTEIRKSNKTCVYLHFYISNTFGFYRILFICRKR